MNYNHKKLNNLYIYLKKIDKYLFNEWKNNYSSLNDNEYFRLGILFDIEQNLRCVIHNILFNNVNSIGVDYSCRMIIEGMSILEMDNSNKISNIQKSIYRRSYSAIEYSNLKQITKNGVYKNDKNYYEMLKDLDKYKELVSQQHCIKKDELKIKGYLCDPQFYLKQDVDEKLSFAKLINTYLRDGWYMIYSFFSIISHPRYETDNNIENKIRIKRKDYINRIIKKSERLLLNEKSLRSISKDISKPQEVSEFQSFLQQQISYNLNDIFTYISNEVRVLPDGVNDFFIFFLNKFKSLIIEMYSSESEHLITLFTPYIEYLSIFWFSWKLIGTKEFIYILNGYKLSSRIQFKRYKIIDCLEIKNNLRKIFEEFYKNEFNLNDFNNFYKECTQDAKYCFRLYFKKRNIHNLSKYHLKIFQMIDEFSNVDYQKEYIGTLYSISRDMAHSTGYNFNATPGLVWFSYIDILISSFQILIDFFEKIQTTLINYSHPINVKKVIDYIKNIILDLKDQRQYYEKIAKDADQNTKRK